MSFSLQPNAKGRSTVVLVGEPPYIVPLQIAAPSLEGILKNGKWLITAISIWSIHDLEAAHRAIEMAKHYGGQFRLGLRPFDYPEEILAWLPDTLENTRDSVDIEVAEQQGKCIVSIKGRSDEHPVWAAIVDGDLVDIRFGQLSQIDLEDLIGQLLAGSDKGPEKGSGVE